MLECWSNRAEHLHGIVWCEGAFAAGARENHALGDGRERTPDAGEILVAQDGENDRGALVAELLPPCFSQDLRAARVMCAVDNRALTFDGAHVNLARGDDYPDALAGGPHAGEELSPVLLTSSSTVLGPMTRAWLTMHSSTLLDGHLFGGTSAMNCANA